MSGIDTNTKLMLHLNGDDADTSTNDSSGNLHIATFVGTAEIDTADKQFGPSSLLLDGDSDFLTIPDSTDWNILDPTDNTLDLWVKLAENTQEFIGQFIDSANFWTFRTNVGALSFIWRNGGGDAISISGGSVSLNVWNHVAMCKVGTDIGIYLNGVQVAYQGSFTDTNDLATILHIGVGINNQHVNGWMDEIRIQESNFFSASPNVGLTDIITVPNKEYTGDRNTRIRGSQLKDSDVTVDDLSDLTKIEDINFVIDGGGSVISTGVAGDIEISFDAEIQQVTLLSDQTGSVVIDIFKDEFSNFPPVVGDSITASAKPTISASNKSQDSTLTSWTKDITAGDILRFNVDSVSTIERCLINLKIKRC